MCPREGTTAPGCRDYRLGSRTLAGLRVLNSQSESAHCVHAAYNATMDSAVKVGALVVLMAGMVIGVFALLQRSVFAQPMDEYIVEFEDAGGLSRGARVLFAGVTVGQVSDVQLVGTQAEVTIRIQADTPIPVGSVVKLPSSLISLGDRQVEIVPGTSTALLEPGSRIRGELVGALENFLPDSEATLRELNNTLVAVQDLLGDEALRGGVVNLMETSAQTAEQFGNLAGRIDGLIVRNAGGVEQLLAVTEQSLRNVNAITEEVRDLVASGQFQDQTSELLATLNEAVFTGTALIEDLRAIANDPELRAQFDRSLNNVEQLLERGNLIAMNTERITANGVLASEEAVVLMQKVNALADDVGGLIEDVRGTVTGIATRVPALTSNIGLEASLTRETDPNRNRVDVVASVPFGSDRLRLGLYDAFESNRLIAQFQRNVQTNLGLRYGVYASQPGVGVDYRVAPRVDLRADLFGLNEPQFDLRATYQFGSGTFGSFAIERVFDRNAPAIGFGIQR